VKLTLAAFGWKEASTAAAAFSVTEQVGALPVQAPDHPEKLELPSGSAASVTCVPSGCVVLQLVAQAVAVPPMVARSVPPPVPFLA
jgi:hypothetical protein